MVKLGQVIKCLPFLLKKKVNFVNILIGVLWKKF